jgi:hypothetical protein
LHVAARSGYLPTKGYASAYGCSAYRWRGKSVCAVAYAQPKAEVEDALVAYLKRRVFALAVLEGFVQEVRRELEQHLATPAADAADMETELRRLEQEKARLIKLAATTDDDPDIADEVNDRRKPFQKMKGPPL